VAQALQDLFASPEQLTAMSAGAAKLARPDAAAQIIEECSNRGER
jgi:UDP-N-acetylglucosamine:LPS N-acetylglucosamine transferase